MKNIKEVDSDVDLESGTVLRVYGVHRRDVMKLIEDRDDPRKKAKDYYDFLLFDANNIRENTFAMVNVTANSSHRGYVYTVIESDTRYPIKAGVIKQYFKDVDEVYILKGTAAK